MNVAALVGPGDVVPVATARKFGPQQRVPSPAGGNAELLTRGQLFRGVAARDAVVPDRSFRLAVQNCRLKTTRSLNQFLYYTGLQEAKIKQLFTTTAWQLESNI